VLVEFGILGPLEITGMPESAVSGPRQRCLLALFLLEPGQVVPFERIADAMWGDDWPDTVRNAVHVMVSRLRRTFGGTGVGVLARGNGYLLDIAPEQVDLHRFRALVTQARSDDDEPAAALYERALALWRGEPLAGIESVSLQQQVAPALARERLGVLLDYHDVALRLDRAAALIPGMLTASQENPYQERLCAQLMTALHRTGRSTEALELYRRFRHRLAEDLGLDPGDELRSLEQAILRGDPPRTPRRPGGHWVRPAQLPPTAGDFTGREQQLDELLATLTGRSPAVELVALAGQGGVGKTALALRAAHAVADRFPDGQLYVDLHGTHGEPRDPAGALSSFLLSLGVDGSAIPDGVDDRAALFRTRLAGRRVLVVLDNAAGEAQVRPLLPGSAGSAVVITGRARLAGLEGCRTLDVEVFTPEQAVRLLARIVGDDRVAAEPAQAQEIARLCGHLPLAMRVAGAKLVARSRLSIGQLAERLADEHGRLDELVAGDLAVRASLAFSYAGLRPQEQWILRLLGVLDVPDFASWVCAALLGEPMDRAERLLDALVDVHLVEIAGTGPGGQTRYRLHDLTRLFAREKAVEDGDPAEDEPALRRACTAWLALARIADGRLDNRTLERVEGPDPDLVCAEAPDILGAEPARWFDVEARNLRALVRTDPGGGWQVAEALVGYFEYRVLSEDWERTHRAALAHCERSGDKLGQAVILRGLSDRAWGRGSTDCVRYARRADALFAELGHETGRAQALSLLGLGLRLEGRFDLALRAFADSRRLAARHGRARTMILSLVNEMIIFRARRQLDEALACVLEVRRLAETTGFARAEAEAWMRLGSLRADRGQWGEAVEAYRAAAVGFQRLGQFGFHLLTLAHLGELQLRMGELAAAEETLERAVEEADGFRHHSSSFLPMETLAEVHIEQGRHELAVTELTGYIAEYRTRRLVSRLPSALAKLGRAHAGAGRPEDALAAWRECRALHAEFGDEQAVVELDGLLASVAE
jgi:DNA-binding SARP family transcriptional activator/tetratricopeptide (TPR) repeat protein